jgi:hypothetical protein
MPPQNSHTPTATRQDEQLVCHADAAANIGCDGRTDDSHLGQRADA